MTMHLSPTDTLWLAAYAATLGLATWHDATERRIPNRVVFAGALTALGLSALPGGIGWLQALGGLATGLAVWMPLYLVRVMGAGDVKLMAAVGAFTGFSGVLGVSLATLVAGGVLSLVWAVRHAALGAMLRNLRTGLCIGIGQVTAGRLPQAADFPVSRQRMPYAVAISAGAVAQLLLANRFG